MRIKILANDARKLILSIPHQTCAKALDEHWKVSADGTVRAQSVLWLFCWAKTGMNSEEARQVSAQVFNEILPISFADFDGVVDHAYARECRYTNRDIEDEFDGILARLV